MSDITDIKIDTSKYGIIATGPKFSALYTEMRGKAKLSIGSIRPDGQVVIREIGNQDEIDKFVALCALVGCRTDPILHEQMMYLYCTYGGP